MDEVSFREDGETGEYKYFVLTGFPDREERLELECKIKRLGARVLYDVMWNDQITHIVSRAFASTELVLAGLAAGRWVITRHFIDESYRHGKFLNAKQFVHSECVVTHRKNWFRFDDIRGGAFYNMKAYFMMDDIETKEVYQRIVYAGGGNWKEWRSFQEPIRKRCDGRDLTHLILDPWILDSQDPRHDDFQDWLEYEKRVSLSSSNDYGGGPRWQNGGVVHKLHYTYLIDKLLRPLENVSQFKYNIFNGDIKKMALKRRDIRRRQRIKMEKIRLKREQEDSDDEDLETIKKRLESRKRKGRFYIDRVRIHETIPEQEMRVRSESSVHNRAGKRRIEASNLVADLGYMEKNSKKNKRSAGSLIQADPSRHYNADGTVKTGQLLQDYGHDDVIARQNEYLRTLQSNIQQYSQSHPLNMNNRSATFRDSKVWYRQFKQEQIKQENIKREAIKRETKAEEITLSDSDSDIEVLSDNDSMMHGVKKADVDKDMKLPPGIVMITHPPSDDDDDIVVLEDDEEPVIDQTEEEKVEDKKPPLKDLIARLSRLPEIVLCSSDSEDEAVIVPKISTLAHDDIAAEDEIAESRDETTVEDASEDMEIVKRETPSEEENETVVGREAPSEDIQTVREETALDATTQLSDADISMNIREECMRMMEDLDDTNEEAIDKDISKSAKDHSSVDKQIVTEERMEEEPIVSEDMEVIIHKEAEQVVPDPDQDDEEPSETVQSIASFLQEQSPQAPALVESFSPQDLTSSVKTPALKPKEAILKDPQLNVPKLDFSSSLLQNLNSTIVRNQGDKCDHLLTSHVFIANTLYDKNGDTANKRTKTLAPVPSHILQEFDQFTSYQETQDSRTSSRRRTPRTGKKKKQGNNDPEPDPSGLGMEVSRLRNMMVSLTLLKVSSFTLIQPEILNIIWRQFLLNSHPSIVSQTETFLRQYFMLCYGKKGCYREAVADSVLNSLREVTSWNMYKTFDKTNPRDLSMVTSFVQDVVDKCVEGAPGARTLLNIVIHICDLDYKVWRLGKVGTYPMLYYIFGGPQGFSRTVTRVLPQVIKVNEVEGRTLTALVAMMTASLDDKDGEALVSQGAKGALAEVVAKALEADQEEITMLQPSWFSFLVSKQLLEKQTSNSFKQLRDIHGVEYDHTQNSLVLETMAYKYCAFNNLAQMLRGLWFHGSCEDQDERKAFEVFSRIKNLSLEDKSRKSKDVVLKSSIRLKSKTQNQDLHLLHSISKDEDNKGDQQGALQALFFRMSLESDLDWLSFTV